MRAAAAVALALAAAILPFGAGATDWSTARKVRTVTLEYVFKPADLTFQQGVAYRLRVDNKGKETHEFTAPDFFKTVELRDAKPLNADHTEIVVQPGEHKDLYFVAKQAGSYKLTCSDHAWTGMVGSITVSP